MNATQNVLTIKLTSDAEDDYARWNCYSADAELFINGILATTHNNDRLKVYFNYLKKNTPSELCDWSNPDGAHLNGAWIADKFEGVNKYKGYIVEYLNTDGSPL